MESIFADLHIHTTYSDGTLTPAEVIDAAVRANVGLLAICDHNVVEGALAAVPLAKAAGVRLIPGVELDSMLLGYDTHILCYGADFSDPTLRTIIRDARARLDQMSDDLLLRMLPDFRVLDAEEYARFPMDHAQGGWKLLQYLVQKGVTRTLKDAMPFYDQYDVTYAQAGFLAAEDVVAAIHAAKGVAVLAHPEVTFGDRMEDGLRAALACGMDGIECHYPKHSPHLTARLRAFCQERDWMITSGSDCHGAFGRSAIGDPGTRIEQIHFEIGNQVEK